MFKILAKLSKALLRALFGFGLTVGVIAVGLWFILGEVSKTQQKGKILSTRDTKLPVIPTEGGVEVAEEEVPLPPQENPLSAGIQVSDSQLPLDPPVQPARDVPQAVPPKVETPKKIPELMTPEELAFRRSADEFFDRGKYPEALASYEKLEKARPKDDRVAAYALLREGQCRVKQNRPADGFSIWNRLRSYYPQTASASQSLLLEAGHPANALKSERLLDELLGRFPQSNEAASLLLKRGEEAFRNKDYRKALASFERIVRDFPQHEAIEEIQRKLESAQLVIGGDQSVAGALEAEDLLRRGTALFDRALYKEAAAIFQDLIQKNLKGKEASLATGRLAACYGALGKDRDALDLLQNLSQLAPEGAPQALGELVIRCANDGKDALRKRATQEILTHYPESFEAEQALFISGNMAMHGKNRAEGEKYLHELLERYPHTDFRVAAERQLQNLENEKSLATKDQEERSNALLEEQRRENQRAENRKNWEAEAREFESVSSDYNESPARRGECFFQLGERYFNLSRYETAIKAYQKVWEEFPEHPLADDAAFRAAQVHLALGQVTKADEQTLFFINRYGAKSGYAPTALFGMGTRAILYRADLDYAWSFYEKLISDFPNDLHATQAREFWQQVKQLSKAELKAQVAEHNKLKGKS